MDDEITIRHAQEDFTFKILLEIVRRGSGLFNSLFKLLGWRLLPFPAVLVFIKKVDIQNVIYFLSDNSLSHQIIREEMIIFRLVLAGFHIGTVYITAIN